MAPSASPSTRAAIDDATGSGLVNAHRPGRRPTGSAPIGSTLNRPPDEPINLRLVDDSVPISGRILDLQGRPVVGARVTRGRINAEGAEGIDPYLKRLREDPGRPRTTDSPGITGRT